MSRRSVCACGLWGLLVVLSGCSSARYVSSEPNGGVVAIPHNSNSWPDYNRKHAEELMKQQCPEGYVIDREAEVVVGSTEHTNVSTEKKGDALLAAVKLGSVEENRRETTYRTDQTEWRIWFHAKGTAPAGPPTGPPEPIAATSSSGSITSPLPLRMYV